jgi:hypothetical protein
MCLGNIGSILLIFKKQTRNMHSYIKNTFQKKMKRVCNQKLILNCNSHVKAMSVSLNFTRSFTTWSGYYRLYARTSNVGWIESSRITADLTIHCPLLYFVLWFFNVSRIHSVDDWMINHHVTVDVRSRLIPKGRCEWELTFPPQLLEKTYIGIFNPQSEENSNS